MQIHARKMNVDPDVNYEELARSTDDFNGAQCELCSGIVIAAITGLNFFNC